MNPLIAAAALAVVLRLRQQQADVQLSRHGSWQGVVINHLRLVPDRRGAGDSTADLQVRHRLTLMAPWDGSRPGPPVIATVQVFERLITGHSLAG